MHLERLLIDLGLDTRFQKRASNQPEARPDEIAFAEHAVSLVRSGKSLGPLTAHQRAMLLSAWRSATYVYFILSDEADVVKIGKSKRPVSRLSDLRIGSPVRLRLLFSFMANQSTEGQIHKYLSGSRSHGEWFRLDGKVLHLMDVAADHGLKGVMWLIDFEERGIDSPALTG